MNMTDVRRVGEGQRLKNEFACKHDSEGEGRTWQQERAKREERTDDANAEVDRPQRELLREQRDKKDARAAGKDVTQASKETDHAGTCMVILADASSGYSVEMDAQKVLEFLRSNRLAVQASLSYDAPQAAVVGFAISDAFEIVFDTLQNTRKAVNLRHNPHIALVIGG